MQRSYTCDAVLSPETISLPPRSRFSQAEDSLWCLVQKSYTPKQRTKMLIKIILYNNSTQEVCSLASSVQAVLAGMFCRCNTWFELINGGCFCETAHLWNHGPPPCPDPVGGGEGGRLCGRLFFLCVCVCSIPSCRAAGSVQFYGAVLRGFFGPIIILARTHQAVQQIAWRVQNSNCHFSQMQSNRGPTMQMGTIETYTGEY